MSAKDKSGGVSHRSLRLGDVRVDAAIYGGQQGCEIFCMIHPEADASPRKAICDVEEALRRLPLELGKEYSAQSLPLHTLFSRIYLSDPANQIEYCDRSIPNSSILGQRPLSGDNPKVAAWVWLVERNEPERICHSLRSPAGVESHKATFELLAEAESMLAEIDSSIARNCHRTWFFARDIDNNYQGVVTGRNEYFDRIGLTADTHFITSTGIEGCSEEPHSIVALDLLSFPTIPDTDVVYLKGSTHLNPTAEYGVAFERGTAVDLPDRRLTMISGTASIDNRGDILHVGDVAAQTERMLTNVGVLLDEAGARWSDLMHAIVYLRDPSDLRVVEPILKRQMGDTPLVIVHAPVCRPGWLIEMECMALSPRK